MITKQLHADVIYLNEVRALFDEVYGEFLSGFTKWINNDFKSVFQHLHIQERSENWSHFLSNNKKHHPMIFLLENLHYLNSRVIIELQLICIITLSFPINGWPHIITMPTSNVMEIMLFRVSRNFVINNNVQNMTIFEEKRNNQRNGFCVCGCNRSQCENQG